MGNAAETEAMWRVMRRCSLYPQAWSYVFDARMHKCYWQEIDVVLKGEGYLLAGELNDNTPTRQRRR